MSHVVDLQRWHPCYTLCLRCYLFSAFWSPSTFETQAEMPPFLRSPPRLLVPALAPAAAHRRGHVPLPVPLCLHILPPLGRHYIFYGDAHSEVWALINVAWRKPIMAHADAAHRICQYEDGEFTCRLQFLPYLLRNNLAITSCLSESAVLQSDPSQGTVAGKESENRSQEVGKAWDILREWQKFSWCKIRVWSRRKRWDRKDGNVAWRQTVKDLEWQLLYFTEHAAKICWGCLSKVQTKQNVSQRWLWKWTAGCPQVEAERRGLRKCLLAQPKQGGKPLHLWLVITNCWDYWPKVGKTR